MKREEIFDLFSSADDAFVSAAIESRKAVCKTAHRTKNVFLLAAAIALTALLAGCGVVYAVYALGLQDLKLGDRKVATKVWDRESAALVQGTKNQQVLTLSGVKGSPSYEAAKEWHDFMQKNDLDKTKPDWPVGYYHIPKLDSQEMVDKMEEICAKYDLKPLGTLVEARSNRCLLEYLGIENVLRPDAPAEAPVRYIKDAKYYDSGYFSLWFDMQMQEGEGVWPYQSEIGFFYTPKDCFNMQLFMIDGNDCQERHYTTKSGHDVLILGWTRWGVEWGFCDVGDATIALCLPMRHVDIVEGDDGTLEFPTTAITDEQLNQILDTINFDLKLTPGDPSALDWTSLTGKG